jgi:hypothetical protein
MAKPMRPKRYADGEPMANLMATQCEPDGEPCAKLMSDGEPDGELTA